MTTPNATATLVMNSDVLYKHNSYVATLTVPTRCVPGMCAADVENACLKAKCLVAKSLEEAHCAKCCTHHTTVMIFHRNRCEVVNANRDDESIICHFTVKPVCTSSKNHIESNVQIAVSLINNSNTHTHTLSVTSPQLSLQSRRVQSQVAIQNKKEKNERALLTATTTKNTTSPSSSSPVSSPFGSGSASESESDPKQFNQIEISRQLQNLVLPFFFSPIPSPLVSIKPIAPVSNSGEKLLKRPRNSSCEPEPESEANLPKIPNIDSFENDTITSSIDCVEAKLEDQFPEIISNSPSSLSIENFACSLSFDDSYEQNSSFMESFSENPFFESSFGNF